MRLTAPAILLFLITSSYTHVGGGDKQQNAKQDLGSVSWNFYGNNSSRSSFQFPHDWTTLAPEPLRQANKKATHQIPAYPLKRANHPGYSDVLLVATHPPRMVAEYWAEAQFHASPGVLTRASLEGDTESANKTQKANRILAICALFVSVLSLATSIYFSWCAREHNRLSVRPLPFILQPDYVNRIAVIIQNSGTGPLILHKAQAKRPSDGRSGHLIDLIPKPPPGLVFRNFNKIEQTRAIRPGDSVDLVVLTVDVDDPRAVEYRQQLRRALGEMTVELTYTDIYDTRFPIYSWKLDWFRR